MTATQPSPASGPAIELEGVSKNFGPLAALRNLTAALARARLICLLGENGAGKSTLMRVIAGLLRPTRGVVRVLGSADLRAAAPQVGYMPHASMLYDELSAMENLRYFTRLYGITDDAPCARAIQTVGLDPGLERRVGQYSQGMRQRLSLARVLVHDPALLLLDEPFSNVDAGSAQHMVNVLGALRDAGKSVLVITHQPALLAGAADESLVMSEGRLLERSPGVPAANAAVKAGRR